MSSTKISFTLERDSHNSNPNEQEFVIHDDGSVEFSLNYYPTDHYSQRIMRISSKDFKKLIALRNATMEGE